MNVDKLVLVDKIERGGVGAYCEHQRKAGVQLECDSWSGELDGSPPSIGWRRVVFIRVNELRFWRRGVVGESAGSWSDFVEQSCDALVECFAESLLEGDANNENNMIVFDTRTMNKRIRARGFQVVGRQHRRFDASL